ncbi:MAG: hypothetical protein OES69_13040 [Myxococcales bacterium]|nr:hypothetical protein [Myxococcales bacterium]MDH3844862.1 hypothetical protein [Myxococcales bacterium]
MRSLTCFLWLFTLTAGCVLEDKFLEVPDGSVEAGLCGFCDSATPACNETTQMCVECTAQNASACIDSTPVCNTDDNKCVECVASSDCDDPTAAGCDTELNECVECAGEADCDGIEGLPLCNAGTCVECVPATEDRDCGGNSCNPDNFACTATMLASRDTCQTCVSDSECQNAGNRCVAMEYQGAAYPDELTGFCLKTTEGGCEQPYSITLENRPSLSDAAVADYCGINEELATCEAVRGLLTNVRCDGGDDQDCPQPSGLCRQVGSLENRCTYACQSLIECLEDIPLGRPGSTCGSSGSGGDDYCGG